MPIVALTADAFERDRENCLAAGMDGFLTKPVDLGQLRRALPLWLRQAPSAEASKKVETRAAAEDALFDEAGMLRRFGGNRELARRIIGSAINDAPGYFNEMEAAIAAGKGKEAERAAHTLKGLMAQIGGNRLSSELGHVQERFKRGTPIDPATVEALRREYALLKDALSLWIG